MDPVIAPELKLKLLSLIADNEGGWDAVAGNHDGQLLSFGCLQWNVGQGTLQPLLASIAPEVLSAVLGAPFAQACGSQASLEAFVRGQVLSGKTVKPEYVRALKTLAQTTECRNACSAHADKYIFIAWQYCKRLGFTSERALALCFDIAVQNAGGGIRQDHLRAYASFGGKVGNDEWVNLKALAHGVASCALSRWRLDVLSRKLAIALGGTAKSGMLVHGRSFDLERDYGIRYHKAFQPA